MHAAAIVPGQPTPLMAVVMATPSEVFNETGLLAAVLLTGIGIALHVWLPRHQESAEEQVKDGTLSDEQARQRQRLLRRCAWTALSAGVLVLLMTLVDFAY